MEIKCTFSWDSSSSSTGRCVIFDQVIPDVQDLKFIGAYDLGKTNVDIHYVSFYGCTFTKVPKGITKSFPNLEMLWTDRSKIKTICKEDIAEYKNLQRFACNNNEIEFLPGDLFENFKNLDYIDFSNNKLKVIEPNILDELDKLENVNFRGNPNYELHFSKDTKLIFQKPTEKSVEEVKMKLFENYPKKFELYEKLKKSEEKLKNENQQLKDSKLNLKNELKQEQQKNSELTDKIHTGFYNDIKIFTQEEATKDFSIKIDDHEFPVHKFLLAARSPTLAEILKNNPEVENLNLVDISVEIFEIILKFLYTDELPGDDGTNFLHLFAAAGKLKIEKMKVYAASKLTNMVDQKNAMEVFNLSNKYGHDELRQKAFDEIKKMYPKYDFKDAWISNFEFVTKLIEQFKKHEEAIRKLEEEFNINSI